MAGASASDRRPDPQSALRPAVGAPTALAASRSRSPDGRSGWAPLRLGLSALGDGGIEGTPVRFITRSLTGVFLMALTAGLLAFAGGLMLAAVEERAGREGGGHPAEERVLAVRTVVVEPGTIAPVLEAFGELRARRELEIRAPAAGRIVALSEAFEEGGRVEAGERLVAIDPSQARAALERARAEAAEAEADLRDAERGLPLARDELAAARAQAGIQARALERARSLAGRGVGTEAAIEGAEIAASSAGQSVLARRQAVAAAEARVDQARARIARAGIDLAEAERGLADTELRAAFDGVLADVSVIEGGLVGLNERLARLVDPARLEAVFRVSAAQYAQLTREGGALAGLPVEVSLGVSDAEVGARGVVSRESAGVGEGGTGRTLYARLEAAPGLRPGDFVQVRVVEPPLEGVARLPASALGADGTVLALGRDDRLALAPVTLMRRQGDDVLVRAPDLAGRAVVAERSPLLGPGIKVRPVGPEAAAEPAPGPDRDGARTRAAPEGAGVPAAAQAGDEGPARPSADEDASVETGGSAGGPVEAAAPGVADAPVEGGARAELRDRAATASDDAAPAEPVTPVRADAPAAVFEPAAAGAASTAVGSAEAVGPGRGGAPAAAARTLALTDARRARLRAAVEADAALPSAGGARLLADLDRPLVPAATVGRIEPGRVREGRPVRTGP